MTTRFIMWTIAAVLLCAAAHAEDAPDDTSTDQDTREPAPSTEPYNPFELEFPLSNKPDAEKVRLRFFGQHRTRFELRTPATYGSGLAEQAAVSSVNMRTRLGVDAQFPYSTNVLLEIQDVRLWGDEPRAAANTFNKSGLDSTDILQAHLYTRNLFDLGVQAWLGRQKFTVGNQRLISTLEWAPASRTWDGVRARRSFFDEQFHVRALAMLVNDEFRVSDDEWMLGLSFMFTPAFLPRHEFEILALFNNRDAPGGNNDAGVVTSSLRWNGWFGLNADESLAIDFTAEGIAQFGTADSAYWGTPGKDDANVKAFAAALTFDFVVQLGDHKLRAGLGYDYASGDSDPTDNDFQTFRSPFPFGHKYNGWADQVGWRNLHDYAVSASWTYTGIGWVDAITVAAQFHSFYRDNDDDAWYSPGGTAIRTGTPDESNEIGNEVDLLIKFKVNRWVDFEIGWAHFFAGRFVKQTRTGTGPGSDNEASDMDFAWAQLTFKF